MCTCLGGQGGGQRVRDQAVSLAERGGRQRAPSAVRRDAECVPRAAHPTCTHAANPLSSGTHADVHHWVRTRIEKGRPLPETQEELTQLLASDKEGLKRDFALRMAKQSGSMAGMRHAQQRAGRKRRY